MVTLVRPEGRQLRKLLLVTGGGGGGEVTEEGATHLACGNGTDNLIITKSVFLLNGNCLGNYNKETVLLDELFTLRLK